MARRRCRPSTAAALRVAGCALVVLLNAVSPILAQPQEVAPGVFRVEQILAARPFDDLAPLGELVGDATWVGLGEGVHTSGGFYRAKLRMIQYLVRELGFRAIGIESSWIDAGSAERWVRTCEGSPDEAIGGLFGVWRSESVRDLLVWLCRFNRQHPDDRVAFFGFDSWQSPQDARRLRAFLDRIGLGEGHPLVAGLDRCLMRADRYDTTPLPIDADDHRACLDNLDGIEAFLDRDPAAVVAATSARRLAVARIHIVGLRATEGFLYFGAVGDGRRSFEARDLGMARIAEARRDLLAPGARTIVWAHNAHIAKDDYFDSWRMMGRLLAARHGARYRTIGLVAEETLIDWPMVGCGRISTPAQGSVERRLGAFGAPFLLADLGAPDAVVGPNERLQVDHTEAITPAANFDGLFFLARSPAMRPLGWPACGAETVGASTDPVPGCSGVLGAGDFCSRCGPCLEGEGDCDRDSDCAPGLACTDDRGAAFGFGAGVDVCLPLPSGGGGGPPGSCAEPLGSGRFCSRCGPCGVGEGDCDSDAECAAGLTCTENVGADYGFAPAVDVCTAAGGSCAEPLGGGRFCRACGPCAAGEGDCDHDGECRPGLRCVDDVGELFGFAPGVDVCR